jgi:hypothetical protein
MLIRQKIIAALAGNKTKITDDIIELNMHAKKTFILLRGWLMDLVMEIIFNPF